MQKPDGGEPRTPEQYFVHVLHIDDAEDEDEFVEDVVPELVLDALRLGHAQAAEHGALQHEAEQRQRAVRYVDHGLEQYIAIHIFCKKLRTRLNVKPWRGVDNFQNGNYLVFKFCSTFFDHHDDISPPDGKRTWDSNDPNTVGEKEH